MKNFNKRYILALDQGTTSSRAVLIDKRGTIFATAQKEFKQLFPQPGWVEHDPFEIWTSQVEVARDVIRNNGVDTNAIAGVGITNQRETTVVWDRSTGRPLYNAIVWQDRRTSEFCDELKHRGLTETIRQKTGLLIDAYFSATKLKWILDNVIGARVLAEKGRLAFGTIDTWLIWNLTGGKIHATDATNASRTMLFNIHSLTWDDALLDIFNIPPSVLPEVKSSSEIYAETAAGVFNAALPICGIAGDQQAALFGQMCVKAGMIKNTYGTGCFMIMNTGDAPVVSENNLLTTLAWVMGGKATYALEGSIFIGGAVVQWLRDGLKIIKESKEVEELARAAKDNGGVYLVPAFTGLGAPHWDPYARGTIVGITRGTTQSHIARAALESIAYQTKDVLDAMTADSHIPAKELRVDGGASINRLLMQFQADILGIKVIRPNILETTAMGSGFLAGLAVGFWESLDEINLLRQKDTEFLPGLDKDIVQPWLDNWKEAVNRSKNWSR
ncbi:MAG: glycerol kinase GlpK [Desulfobacterales bacterium]|nr:glycerol kinase GlpK [Desulfobacterales bacterium]